MVSYNGVFWWGWVRDGVESGRGRWMVPADVTASENSRPGEYHITYKCPGKAIGTFQKCPSSKK